MRGSTALFVAGAAAIVSGAGGPVLAADEPAHVTAVPTVESADDAAHAEDSAVGDVDVDAAPATEAGGGLARPSLEPAIDDRDGERQRRAKAAVQDPEQSKQPLADASVTMKNIDFKPKTVSIAPGDRVTWTNRDTAQHNAVDRGEFQTPLLERGERASVTIDQAGTYDYICTVHPGMKGKLVAESAGGGSAGSKSSSGSTSSSGGTGTGSSTGSSGAGTLSGSSSGSSSSGGSSGSLPNTGQEQLPLLILGAGLIVAGLLARAFHEYWIWR